MSERLTAEREAYLRNEARRTHGEYQSSLEHGCRELLVELDAVRAERDEAEESYEAQLETPLEAQAELGSLKENCITTLQAGADLDQAVHHAEAAAERRGWESCREAAKMALLSRGNTFQANGGYAEASVLFAGALLVEQLQPPGEPPQDPKVKP